MSIRFAILGAGRIGQVHARAVDGNENAVLTAVFDPVDCRRRFRDFRRYGAEIRHGGRHCRPPMTSMPW